MNLNQVIVEWSKRTGKEVPANVRFRNWSVMEETAEAVGWVEFPSFEECNSIWNEMHDIWDLEAYKENSVAKVSDMSLELRRKIYTDYQCTNATMKLYSREDPVNGAIKEQHISDVNYAFRNEFYRLKNAIDLAQSIDEVNQIIDNHKFEEIK